MSCPESGKILFPGSPLYLTILHPTLKYSVIPHVVAKKANPAFYQPYVGPSLFFYHQFFMHVHVLHRNLTFPWQFPINKLTMQKKSHMNDFVNA